MCNKSLIKYYLVFTIIILNCSNKLKFSTTEKNILNDSVLWYQKVSNKEIGISLEKFYSSNKKKRKIKQIIVAVIDTHVDIEHEDLKNQIWINKKEIPNNNTDDDNNGYIDDINGWNFISYEDKSFPNYFNFEYTRIVKKYKYLDGLKKEVLNSNDIKKYELYNKALLAYNKEYNYIENWLKSIKHLKAVYKTANDTVKYFLKEKSSNINSIDSLYNLKKINDKSYIARRNSNDNDLGALIDYVSVIKSLGYNPELMNKLEIDFTNKLNNYLNTELIEPDNSKKGNGSNIVCNRNILFENAINHSTKVAGIIAATRNNNIGVSGFHNNIKIMPLVIATSGDERDEDIANAIYYAVNNGAKIINMSFAKKFSLNPDIVKKAILYAEKKGILLVHAASNDAEDVDINDCFPTDFDKETKKEYCNNFINVGSTSKFINEKLVSSFSNYGKNNVDLFAPGDHITSTISKNRYELDGGTSLAAPMVSGTAALIWLYYPKLTAKQVKDIIMESGTSYDIEVLVPGTTDKKVKFSELSKSGKVLNVYHAMLLAEKVSKSKTK